ncbi:MAG: molybdopterin-dependent oxidoreductase [Thermodesulfobacteriota bacterium]|nr:molybdopterin-dependent oxidoreductase [Thermodesulfobacteriota bacterium]
MELDRRNFIKIVVGGAAGIQLTPLPWKLADDIAIWTQNWPWVPVPPVGEFTHVGSICTLCPGGCGIEVRKVETRAVKIEGRPDYPVNPGGICPLGAAGLQLLYDETIRYTSPMKRVGPRGAGKFMDITWDEALDTLADRISGLRDRQRPEALAAVDGNPIRSTMSLMIERLLKAVGSLNYLRIPSAEDTYEMANTLMLGTEGPMAYDLENADYILSFGSGLLDGWGAPGRVLNAWGLWRGKTLKKRVRVVQVESRASNTASRADQWIAAIPGTEGALALGLAHVIIKERLFSTEFVNNHSFGFNDWMSADGRHHMGFKTMVLDQYSPDKVARITGLSLREIVSLAKDFAGAKAPIAVCGKGKGTLNGSLFELMAVQSLNALTGNINRTGGIFMRDPLPVSPLPEVELDAIARQGLKKHRLDQAGGMRYPFTRSLINSFTNNILRSSGSPVDTLLIFSANPSHNLPDGGAFKRALKDIPFIASFSPFHDETSHMADLILPDHTYLEKMDDVVWPTGLQYPLYGLSKPVVDPVYDTRNTGDVIIQLAKRAGRPLGSAFPWNDFEAVLKARAKGLFDSGSGLVGYSGSRPAWKRQAGGIRPDYRSFEDMWKKIKSGGVWYRPVDSAGDRQMSFKTPTGRFEFFSTNIELAVKNYARKTSEQTALKQMGFGVKGEEAFMPHYEAMEPEVDSSAYPLTMVPYEMINLSSGWAPTPPFVYKTLFDTQLKKAESFVEINPETAAQHDLKEGDRAIVKSTVGEVQVRITLFEGAMPGIVYMPLGFGHTGYDEFIRGKGVNPNSIIDAGTDPLSGQPVWWNTRVRLTKV